MINCEFGDESTYLVEAVIKKFCVASQRGGMAEEPSKGRKMNTSHRAESD